MKIALTSTHSTGKTTLANELIKLPELAGYQLFTEKTKLLKETFGVDLNEKTSLISQYIFVGQRAAELYYPSDSLMDRSIYDVMAYTIASKNISWPEKITFIDGIMPLVKAYDLIIYVDPEGVELEDNGLRSLDDKFRNDINFAIVNLLQEYKPKKLLKVKGTTEERISQIIQYLSTNITPITSEKS